MNQGARKLDVKNPKPLFSLRRIEMNTLTINDLPVAEELAQEKMAAVSGGMGRTPQQILAFEVTGKPATWQGLVLGDDGRLHVPQI
jgi:hypothetical protein